MDHATASNRLSAYIDGELAPESRAALESHLAQCALCAAQLADLRKTSSFLQQLPTSNPTPALLAKLHLAIDSSARRTVVGIDRFVGLLSGIAACLAIVGGLLLLQPAAIASPVPADSWASLAAHPSEDTIASADTPETAITQWMVANLSTRGEP